ncbi:M1 family metallopeptidase [Arthrobacter oryzae]|uniref:M1 family metallopeptidase n=1 Tax=Arthrobacter oryzae TaxID=409290 RepID=UPI00273B329E|nr:M1 family metallopeptidase [Arthrobacter oryzae]WLQ05810.1 M1 family metallopeptidase [Arthrobacter oryzae]
MTADRQPAARARTRARNATAVRASTDYYTPGHGSRDYQVSRYDLHLDYQVTTNRIFGHATITARASTTLRTITLSLAGLRVLKLQLDGLPATRFVQRGNQLILTPDRPLPAGIDFSLEIRYTGSPAPLRGTWGSVGWEELTDGVMVAGQPTGAPTWFPCNDHPSQKASFGFTITTDANYRVICNGVLVSCHVNTSRKTWVFEQAEPMASYLATVQIGRYDLVPLTFHAHPPAHRAARLDGPSPVTQFVAAPPGLMTKARTALARQGQMMDTFQTCFGPYPFSSYTVVIPGDGLDIPLEAQSLSVFGPNHLNQGWESQRLIAHELAHQWFGNSLTATTWADIWLHEGFASYAEWLWSEASGNATAATQARAAWRGLAVNAQDILVGDPGPGSMFDDRVYTRGALAVHALRRAAGDGLFFSFLRAWTEEHRFGSVTTTDLFRTADRICGAVAGFDARTILTPWLYRLPLPAL